MTMKIHSIVQPASFFRIHYDQVEGETHFADSCAVVGYLTTLQAP